MLARTKPLVAINAPGPSSLATGARRYKAPLGAIVNGAGQRLAADAALPARCGVPSRLLDAAIAVRGIVTARLSKKVVEEVTGRARVRVDHDAS